MLPKSIKTNFFFGKKFPVLAFPRFFRPYFGAGRLPYLPRPIKVDDPQNALATPPRKTNLSATFVLFFPKALTPRFSFITSAPQSEFSDPPRTNEIDMS